MATFHHSRRFCFILSIITIVFSWFANLTGAVYHGYVPSPWTLAHATFYGDETASATMGKYHGLKLVSSGYLIPVSLSSEYNISGYNISGGACGYGNLITNGYRRDTAALSTTTFSEGYAYGQCYQIRFVQSPWCYKGYTAVTATNLCLPNWSQDSNNEGWCNPPRTHFDMAKRAFMKIAQWKEGIVPIMYSRVPSNAIRKCGIRFSFQGNGYWLLVYVMNVAGAGDIKHMWVKGTKTGWMSMSHNWGALYQAFATLKGQALSFRLTSYTTKPTITAYNVDPANWNIGLTYRGNVNFH
ncbi:unnamed protein product [Lactuca saligna]|uniref:Expansin n=1 Tax=Lactuca saligna TaxID=75948 RepID=A0AA35ZEY7_LACSI|nr:unnamed protein product [Lactuca saligna]